MFYSVLACTPYRIGTPKPVIDYIKYLKEDYADYSGVISEAIRCVSAMVFETLEFSVSDDYL